MGAHLPRGDPHTQPGRKELLDWTVDCSVCPNNSNINSVIHGLFHVTRVEMDGDMTWDYV
jgi:hypothetical protein